jgi:hypothetical protein
MGYNDVKSYYQTMFDGEIRQLIKEANTLDSIGKKVLLEEAIRRGFDKEEINDLEKDLAELSDDKINQLTMDFTRSSCPICGQRRSSLSGITIKRAISILLVTFTKKQYVIGCKPCLEELLNKAQNITIFFGWWGIPFGLIFTPLYIINNIKAKNNIGIIDEQFKNWIIDNRKSIKEKLKLEGIV